LIPIELTDKLCFMKRVVAVLIACLACLVNGCFPDEEECKQWEMPEINVTPIVYGTAVIRSSQTGVDVTGQYYADITVYTNVKKDHCNGSVSGPFITEFKILSNGVLDKQSLGTYSFSMYNEKDLIEIKLSASPPEKTIDTGKLLFYNYEDLEPYDGGYFNIQIRVDLIFDTQNKTVISGTVTLL